MRISDWSSDVCSSDIAVPEPNPVEYGLGTDGYDRDSYDIAVHNWKQSQAQVQSLLQQRQAIAAQQSQEEERARQTAFNEVEQAAWPKFVETVPEQIGREPV